MTGWYDPPRLVSIAVRVAISTVFGEFADRREAMASVREIDPSALDPAYDYNKECADQSFWLDFVADTGDGWNSTYAIARLLWEPALEVEGVGSDAGTPDNRLPAGRLLVMGGDQVYPTASRGDYRLKLEGPYDEAARRARPPEITPHLYAIPGNHDWYDGLSAFLSLFCRRRTAAAFNVARPGRLIGGRWTNQTRTYFALALPHGWWLWGIDVQLAGYVDPPQVDFFRHAALHWMPPGSRLTLCTGTPEWAYVDPADPRRGPFRNFDYMANIATQAGRSHKLCLVLTGDSHHYARYTEAGINYITAGGGGAFLHPTHQLENKTFLWDFPPPNQHHLVSGPERYQRKFQIASDARSEPALFPSREISRRLTLRNLLFWWFNPLFAVTLGILAGIFAWLLHANAQIENSTLSEFLSRGRGFWSGVAGYFQLLWVTPWPLTLVLSAAGGYIYFADFHPWGKRIRAGAFHAFAQLGGMVALTVVLACHAAGAEHDWFLILCIGLCGGLLASTVIGMYLLLCLNVFGKHWNEAFSSLRISGFKNFLRLRITPDGVLTVFPIGLTKVPADDTTDPKPHLIERPISIP
jgi:hypothetical protein